MSGPTMLAYETNLYSNPYGLKNRVVLPHIQLLKISLRPTKVPQRQEDQ